MHDIAISVSNVSKTFRIPHEKITTIRGAFVSARMAKIDFANILSILKVYQ